MAKLSAVNKNNRRKEKADKYWQYRRELKDKIVNEKLSDEDRMDAQMKLQSFLAIHRHFAWSVVAELQVVQRVF